jgi:eukaryotic-like serine/threonine-protein kinase
LMAQPFDTRRLESRGEAFPVAEQVWLPPTPAQGLGAYSVSRNNGVLAYRTLGQATTELVWFDRQGRKLGTIGEPANYSVPALSRDEKRLAITRIDPQIGTRDLWLFDVANGTPSHFTFDPAEETNPTWSPDGNWIAFSSNEKGHMDIYKKEATGTGKPELLLQSSELKVVESWTPDGRFILYDSREKVWALPLTGDRKPLALFALNRESKINVSPNMRWSAYQSSESGQTEVYVQGFPPSDSKWQISTSGGEEPRWRRDGKELFYIAGKRLMAVDVKTDAKDFQWGTPKPLFELHLQVESLRSRYQVAASGQRFLLSVPLESTRSSTITVLTNWTAGLTK